MRALEEGDRVEYYGGGTAYSRALVGRRGVLQHIKDAGESYAMGKVQFDDGNARTVYLRNLKLVTSSGKKETALTPANLRELGRKYSHLVEALERMADAVTEYQAASTDLKKLMDEAETW